MGSSVEEKSRKKVDDRLESMYLKPGEEDFRWSRRTAVTYLCERGK